MVDLDKIMHDPEHGYTLMNTNYQEPVEALGIVAAARISNRLTGRTPRLGEHFRAAVEQGENQWGT